MRVFVASAVMAVSLVAVMAGAGQAQVSPYASSADWQSLSLVDLMGVEVVSATRQAESLAEAAAVIDVISADDIAKRGYRSVGEALQSVVGLSVRHDHLQYGLGVRGIDGGIRSPARVVKVMIDNQPVSYRPSGENFLGVELVPIAAVARIEILRGPATVMYGANAYLGVVNIITRQGYTIYDNRVGVGYEGGAFDVSPRGRASVGHTLGDFELLLSVDAESHERDGYRIVPLPNRSHPREDEETQTRATPSGSVYGRLAYETESVGRLSLDVNLQRLDRSAEFADWGVMSHKSRVEIMNGYARLQYSKSFTDDLELSASVAASMGAPDEEDRFGIAPGEPTYVRRDNGYAGVDLTAALHYRILEQLSATVGLDGSSENYELLSYFTVSPDGRELRNPPALSGSGRKRFTNGAAFAQLLSTPFEGTAVTWLEALHLTAGTRVDTHSEYGTSVNGRAGVVYAANDLHYIKALWGSAYRAPSANQLYANYITPQGTIGNAELRPERVQTMEIAVATTPIRRLTLRADGYLTKVRDRVEIQEPRLSDAITNASPQNSTPITSWGMEFQVDYRGSAVSAYANYAFQRSHYSVVDGLSLTRDEVDLQTELVPYSVLKVGASWSLPQYFLALHGEGRYVGEVHGHPVNNAQVQGLDFLRKQYHLEPYLVVDATVQTLGFQPWAGRETHLMFKVRNALDAEYALPGTAGFDIPGFRRSYELSVEQEF